MEISHKAAFKHQGGGANGESCVVFYALRMQYSVPYVELLSSKVLLLDANAV